MKIEFLIKLLVVILLILFFVLRNIFTRYYQKFSFKFLIKYLVIVLILGFYFSRTIDFALVPIPLYFRLFLGLILIFGGYSLFFASHNYLGQNWSTLLDKKVSKKNFLIKEGPYKYIRHPTYSASLLALFGFGILSANWIIFLVSFVFLVTFYIYKVPREERFLTEKFGKSYTDYKKTTGGFFPKLI